MNEDRSILYLNSVLSEKIGVLSKSITDSHLEDGRHHPYDYDPNDIAFKALEAAKAAMVLCDTALSDSIHKSVEREKMQKRAMDLERWIRRTRDV